MRSIMSDKRWLHRAVSAAFWLALWQVVSLFVPQFMFAGPVQTVQSLFVMCTDGAFWLSVAGTLAKIAAGYLISFILGCALAALGYRFSWLRILLEPAVQVMKSVPVACFIVVALIWVRSAWISVLTAFFVVFPILYINVLEGLSDVDGKLIEMARLFRIPPRRRFRAIYLPALAPYVLSGCRITVGMALKAGIAGEIIGLPAHSIGEQLYLSKLYLNIDDLFAWAFVIILISALLEKLLVWGLDRLRRGIGGGNV